MILLHASAYFYKFSVIGSTMSLWLVVGWLVVGFMADCLTRECHYDMNLATIEVFFLVCVISRKNVITILILLD